MDIKNKKRKTKIPKEIVAKGIYDHGEIKLSGKKLPRKKMNVVVTFKEEKNDKKTNKINAANDFVKKWSGVIKANDVEIIMEKRLEYLIEKYK